MLEKFENELVLIFVLMNCVPCICVFNLFPKEHFSQFVSKVDALKLLLHVHSDFAIVCADTNFMENVKEGHVQNVAVQVSELDICHLA